MDNAHIAGNMKIRNHVFISVLVALANDNSMGREDGATNHLLETIVGASVSLVPGVWVDENSIVGASALITKDVPNGKVVRDVPAKVVRDV